MKLSIVVPSLNEERTLDQVLEAIFATHYEKEIIVVDDGSTDATPTLLARWQANYPNELRVIRHPMRQGKGAALRDGFAAATGDVVIVQDADGEYHPEDYIHLLRPIQKGWADAVYGCRFDGARRVFLLSHRIGNWLVNAVANILYDTTLTDLETGLKAIRLDALKTFTLRSNDFRIEVELTAKLFKRGYRVYEVPISYSGRSYTEGKKITWRDGVLAVLALIAFRIQD